MYASIAALKHTSRRTMTTDTNLVAALSMARSTLATRPRATDNAAHNATGPGQSASDMFCRSLV